MLKGIPAVSAALWLVSFDRAPLRCFLTCALFSLLSPLQMRQESLHLGVLHKCIARLPRSQCMLESKTRRDWHGTIALPRRS